MKTKKYTYKQKKFIKSKVKKIKFEDIPESICEFWLNYKNKKI